jgi:hypothetical protein
MANVIGCNRKRGLPMPSQAPGAFRQQPVFSLNPRPNA